MQRKFECLKCHNQFEADDQKIVKCPKCGSDNVEIAHFHLPKGWWKWGLAIVFLVGIAFILTKNDSNNQTVPGPDSLTEDTIKDSLKGPEDPDPFKEDPDSIEIPKTPSIIAEKPTYSDNNYSLTFKVKDAPTQKYYVALLEYNGTKEISRSNDGEHFNNVPVSDNQGLYDVAVVLTSNDSVLCRLLVTGFESHEMVKEKMEKERLQALIEDYNSEVTGEKDWIVAVYKLHFTGLSADEDCPENLTRVQIMIEEGRKATITDLKYDDNNRITDIYINVEK